MYRLEDAIQTVARDIRKTALGGPEKFSNQTDQVLMLFKSTGLDGMRARHRAMRHVNRYMRINGINWPVIDWEALLEWLKENWQSILKAILTLLPLILI